MPVAAFIDDGHLPSLGLTNAWGYNPVSYFALDPRLAPRGPQELRTMTDLYRKNGISVILDDRAALAHYAVEPFHADVARRLRESCDVVMAVDYEY